VIDAQALQLLIDMARAGRHAALLSSTADGRATRYDIDGQIVTVDEPPPPRNHFVFELDQLIDYVKSCADGDYRIVAWHHRQGVVLILNDDDRRDAVTFNLHRFEVFALLCQLGADEPTSFDQRSLIRMLERLGVDAAVIAPFRRLDWNTHAAAVGEVTQQRDRLGKEVTGAVTGQSELPDTVHVTTPVYADLGEQDLHTIKCRVDVFPLDHRFILRPLPGEIDMAYERQQASIHERLTNGLDGEAFVFYGKP